MNTLSHVRTTPLGRLLNIPRRFWLALRYYWPQLKRIGWWTFSSREDTNFTYDLTSRNITYLAHTLATVCSCPIERAEQYLEEARKDAALSAHVRNQIKSSRFRYITDFCGLFGRRIGWYALVRLTRPKVVVETGVDKGHGAIIICAALRRNTADGFPGRYYGTDINSNAGFLFAAPYSTFGTILYGDSIESLQKLTEPIDLFINDSDHSSEYERREYEVVASKLSAGAVILGDNAHSNSELANFSRANSRCFLFFKEEPDNHWYPGAGIGISFPAKRVAPPDIDLAMRSSEP